MTSNLWYDNDEVTDFHPHVEECLNKALQSLSLDTLYEVKHHPPIPQAVTIPDFAIKNRSNGKFLFILEVKRTRPDVESERYWIQTKGYVDALGYDWVPGATRYFAITNLEEMITFAHRNEHVTRCMLKDNPKENGNFIRGNNDSLATIKAKLIEELKVIINSSASRQTPAFNNNWLMLVDKFYSTYQNVYSDVAITDRIKKRDVTMHEMLRILLYQYLKTSYIAHMHAHRSIFKNISTTTNDIDFINSLINNYSRVLGIDFSQIFSKYVGAERIIPDHPKPTILVEFRNIVEFTDRVIGLAYADNPSPKIFFSLLTNRVYDWDELHGEGKIMTDSQLSSIVAELAIRSSEDKVIDPGSGDGALLDAAYEKLTLLSEENGQTRTHNKFLSSLHGYEIDSFLNQLATFRLVSKNLKDVDNNTNVDLQCEDLFNHPRPGQFDAVVMNPPFLRNDDPVYPITTNRRNIMLGAIERACGTPSFIRNARQPNLYFYFLNWAPHYLKDGGFASIIIMTKFMNNQDGVHIKKFMKDDLISVISYPRDYFGSFKVTTSIILMQKNTSQDYVTFLKIINRMLLEDPKKIKELSEIDHNEINADYTVRLIAKSTLLPEDNWLLNLIDPEDKYTYLENFGVLKLLNGDLFSLMKKGRSRK